MLVDKEVEINIVSSTVKYYEDIGYDIPKKYNKKAKRFVYNIPYKIKVEVKDLKPSCNINIMVKCDNCGKLYEKQFINYNKTEYDYCYDCRGISISKNKIKHTYEDVKNEFEKRNFKLLENEYKGYTNHHSYICSEGHETSITFKNLLKGRGCKKCANIELGKKKRKNYEEVKKIFEDNNCVLLSKEYKDGHQLLDYICSCGNKAKISLFHFLEGKRCQKCGLKKLGDAFRYDFEYIKQYFEDNDCVLLSTEYKNSNQLLDYICSCGRKSKIRFESFKKGSRCRQCFIERNSGQNHSSWRDDLTDEERQIKRNFNGYYQWRINIYEKDNYTCQICGDDKGGNLNAHHLNGYNWCKEKRLDLNNGITLCKKCHMDFHNLYGFENNTKQQFNEWSARKLENQLLLF